jgi:hypothetical protein
MGPKDKIVVGHLRGHNAISKNASRHGYLCESVIENEECGHSIARTCMVGQNHKHPVGIEDRSARRQRRSMRIIVPLAQLFRNSSLGLLCALTGSLVGQTVINVPLSSPTVHAPLRPGFGGAKPTSFSDISSAFSSVRPLAKWGPVEVRPYFNYQFVYADGILRFPDDAPTKTTQQILRAGALVTLGTRWSLDYSASRTWNSTRLIADYTGHDLRLSGGASKGDWTFGIFQTFEKKAPLLVETGGQTPETSYSTGGSVSYQVGARTLLDLQITRNKRDSEMPIANFVSDSESWSGTTSLHYRFSLQLDVAVAVRTGYDRISNSPDMNYSEPEATINWRPTTKLTLTARGGRETRRFRGGTNENLGTQTYNVTASYQPTQTTTVSASGDRNVSPSYFANQLNKSSGWGINVQQRVLQRFYVSAGFAHGRSRYLAIDRGFAIGRDDNFDSFSVRLSTPVLSRGSAAIFYNNSRNSSNVGAFQFTSYQIGTEIGYRF